MQDIPAVMANLNCLRMLAERNNGTLCSQSAEAKPPVDTTKKGKECTQQSSKSPAKLPSPSKCKSASPAGHTPPPSTAPAPKADFTTAFESKPNDASNACCPDVTSLEDDIRTKHEFSYNPDLVRKAQEWMSAVLKEDLPEGRAFVTALKSGVLLCRLANEISPGCIPKVSKSTIPYAQMERAVNLLRFSEKTVSITYAFLRV